MPINSIKCHCGNPKGINQITCSDCHKKCKSEPL